MACRHTQQCDKPCCFTSLCPAPGTNGPGCPDPAVCTSTAQLGSSITVLSKDCQLGTPSELVLQPRTIGNRRQNFEVESFEGGMCFPEKSQLEECWNTLLANTDPSNHKNPDRFPSPHNHSGCVSYLSLKALSVLPVLLGLMGTPVQSVPYLLEALGFVL